MHFLAIYLPILMRQLNLTAVKTLNLAVSEVLDLKLVNLAAVQQLLNLAASQQLVNLAAVQKLVNLAAPQQLLNLAAVQ